MKRTAITYERPAEPGAEQAGGSADMPADVPARFTVVAAVRDAGGPRRPALAGALERVAAGDAQALVTPRLRAVAGSLREVVALIDWLEAVGADLVALDVGLDTASDRGRRPVAVLREIAGWDRAPEHGRPSRGRPGLLDRRPEIAARIVAMRQAGLSLQAIADALNADGVPTPRGGAQWRPSSVQAALGYRRPHPPAPGAPPPPRPAGPPRSHPRPPGPPGPHKPPPRP